VNVHWYGNGMEMSYRSNLLDFICSGSFNINIDLIQMQNKVNLSKYLKFKYT